MQHKHYHVIIGMSGCYMPDSNYVVSNRREAIAAAREEYRRADNDYDDDDSRYWKQVGVGHYRLFERAADNARTRQLYDLAYEIRTSGPCYEAECMCNG